MIGVTILYYEGATYSVKLEQELKPPYTFVYIQDVFKLYCINLYKQGGFMRNKTWIPYHHIDRICLDG